jgi:hypothetical protein
MAQTKVRKGAERRDMLGRIYSCCTQTAVSFDKAYRQAGLKLRHAIAKFAPCIVTTKPISSSINTTQILLRLKTVSSRVSIVAALGCQGGEWNNAMLLLVPS